MDVPLDPGAVLRERYRILELVGQGGAGAVYRADDLRLPGRVTAVKVILPDLSPSAAAREDALEQFRREASTLARLDHPALPKVSDHFVESGLDCLVMDFVSGPDLRQVVESSRAKSRFLPERQVMGWLAQLLNAVEYLHSRDPAVIHRDIKPANIKLVEGDRIKLVDFGLVKPLDPSDPRTLTTARGVGSLPYTPLEQYAGDTGHTDRRSDIYSIGATLYHLMTGRPPATAQERFLQPNALIRPSHHNSSISPRLESVILTAMALHPADRPDDVAGLRDLVTGAVAPIADPALGTASAAWRAGLWDNAALIALAGLLLVLATLATWQAEHSPSPLVDGLGIGPTAEATAPATGLEAATPARE